MEFFKIFVNILFKSWGLYYEQIKYGIINIIKQFNKIVHENRRRKVGDLCYISSQLTICPRNYLNSYLKIEFPL